MKYLYQTQRVVQAPDLLGDYWFNSEPMSIQSLRGNTVLLFFWDFSFPSSLQFLPLIVDLHARYADLGLTCIGVHSPEFPFGKTTNNIEAALARHGVSFPVIADNEKRIADAYHIPANPIVVLIGPNGNVYDQITSFSALMRSERSIQYLLRQSGFYGELPMLEIFEGWDRNIFEMNTGYLHGSLGNSEGYSPELTASYEDPKYYVWKKFYLHGEWLAERNSCTFKGTPNEGYIIARIDAYAMQILASASGKSSVKVEVDDAPVRLADMGHDVKKDKQGNTLFHVADPKLVSVLKIKDEGDHRVKIIPLTTDVSFYLISYEYKSAYENSQTNGLIQKN
ncbi:MAG: redoxin domain-containing protein [Bacteroidota bacterium]